MQDSNNDLDAALKRGREAVVQHIYVIEQLGQDWKEEAVTETLWQAAAPFVKPIGFTRHEEKQMGADWAWWWIDSSGECFGLLIQAKRFHRRNARLTLNIGANKGWQNFNLLRTADVLEIPAGYVLYAGELDNRKKTTCGALHGKIEDCCEKCSVTVMSALEAEFSTHSAVNAAMSAINDALPLESLGAKDDADPPIYDLNWAAFPDEFREFLQEPQTGARKVAKAFLRKVSESRLGQFSAVREGLETGAESPVFKDLPVDTGHYVRPYLLHIFRGLRTIAPPYVLDAMSGAEISDEIKENLAGVVILQI